MKTLLKKMLWVLMFVGVISMPTVSFSGKSVLNYKVTKLPKNAPKQLKELLGRWQGEWLLNNNEKLKGSLNIINIDLRKKLVVLRYSWGKNIDYGIEPGGYYYTAKIKTGKNPKITFGKYARFEFILKKNGVLEGTRTRYQYYTVISMHKVH